MKKVRPEAKIKTLPDEVQETLWDLLRTPMEGREKPMTYVEARAWLLAHHEVETSNAALSDWYSWYGLRLRTERRKAIVEEAVAELAKSDPTKTLEELQAFGQVLFTAESIEGRDAKAFTEVWRASEKALMRKQAKEQAEADRELRKESLEIDKRKIALLEEKAALADKAKDVMESQESEEEKAAKMRRLFGMG
jgi:hypothetical protein